MRRIYSWTVKLRDCAAGGSGVSTTKADFAKWDAELDSPFVLSREFVAQPPDVSLDNCRSRPLCVAAAHRVCCLVARNGGFYPAFLAQERATHRTRPARHLALLLASPGVARSVRLGGPQVS